MEKHIKVMKTRIKQHFCSERTNLSEASFLIIIYNTVIVKSQNKTEATTTTTTTTEN